MAVSIPDSPMRRAPYGDNPRLGALGNRTRQEIVNAARDLFAESGYRTVTVEEIGARAGRSGPSVYQYFENKSEIFRIFVDELGSELIAHGRRMGDINGSGGFDAMLEFVSGLSEIFRRHRLTAIEWALVEETEHGLRGPAEGFLGKFVDAVAPHFGAVPSGMSGVDVRTLPIAVLSVVQWTQFTRDSRMPSLSQADVDEMLARFMHAVLTAPDDEHDAAPSPRSPISASSQAPFEWDYDELSSGLRRPVTPRSRATVERILRAGSNAFAHYGFSSTTIQDVAANAHIGKATVYTYWGDKEALFSTLAHLAATAMKRTMYLDIGQEFGRGSRAAAHWLDGWLDVIFAHGAVLHIWTHEVFEDSALGPLAQEMTDFVGAHLAGLLTHVPSSGPTESTVQPATILLWALLVEFPYTLSVQLPELDRAQVRDLIYSMIRRGLLMY